MREFVDRTAKAEDHYRFYQGSVMEASDEITLLIEAGKNVVCDRYWMSTYVYHKATGIDARASDFKSIIQPDLVILLTVEKEVQMRRMIQRGLSAGDRRYLDQQQKIADEYLDLLKIYTGKFFNIDTSHISPEQVVKVIEIIL